MSMALLKRVLTLACLAHTGLTVRTRPSTVPGESEAHSETKQEAMERSSTRVGSKGAGNQPKLISMMLLALNRPHGFNLVGRRMGSPMMRADMRNPMVSHRLPNSGPRAVGMANHRFSSTPVMQTREITLAGDETEKSDEELAADCLGEISCSVEYIDVLLYQLKAKENPSSQLTQTIKELEEVRVQTERNARLTQILVQGLVGDDPTERSYGELATECLEDGCSVSSIERLLEQLQAERSPSPQLTQTIKDLEQLLVQEKETDTVIRKLMQGWQEDEVPGKSNEELAADCLEEGCSVEGITVLLKQLKAQENPSPQVTQSIKELEELLVQEEKRDQVMKLFVQGLLADEAIEKSNEKLAAECLQDGCSVESMDALLQELKAEKNPSPELTQIIKKLEDLRVESLQKVAAIEKLVQGLLADEPTQNAAVSL